MGTILRESLGLWLPEVVLGAGALLCLLAGVFSRRKAFVWGVLWATLVAAAGCLFVQQVPPPTAVFYDMVICDQFTLAFRWIALGTTALVSLMVMGSRDEAVKHTGEYAGLLLLVGLGLMVMAEANHLLMAYIGLELVGLSSYLLVGFSRGAASAEAAIKYLLFGAVATAILLFGLSLIYGLTGSLYFAEIRTALMSFPQQSTGLLFMAIMFILVGMAYKISLVPFHYWTPDVYEGAPIPVAALLSVGPKAAGMALLIRFLEMLSPFWDRVLPVLLVLTLITMTYGNLVALVQTNVKRLLAYSTIGQVGYIMIGLLTNSTMGLQAVILYLVAYMFMNLGAFACLVAVANQKGDETLSAFSGLSRREPVMALWTTLCLLSLAGLPPLLGFFGKFYLFGAALDAHMPVLALFGILNSAIALYYYVRIIRQMYLVDLPEASFSGTPVVLRLTLWVCGTSTLLLGLFPGGVLTLLEAASVVHLL